MLLKTKDLLPLSWGKGNPDLKDTNLDNLLGQTLGKGNFHYFVVNPRPPPP